MWCLKTCICGPVEVAVYIRSEICHLLQEAALILQMGVNLPTQCSGYRSRHSLPYQP